MGNSVIIPKTYIEVERPLIFLAGPIRGAPNWQDEAIELLLRKNPNIFIASPRRGIRENIAPYIAQGKEDYFPRQRAWERHYLDITGYNPKTNGCIMFWLPEETKHKCEKSYGAMTRLELGETITRYKFDKRTRFCIGGDGKFSEISTIKYDLGLDAPDKIILDNLEETCIEALRIASQ